MQSNRGGVRREAALKVSKQIITAKVHFQFPKQKVICERAPGLTGRKRSGQSRASPQPCSSELSITGYCTSVSNVLYLPRLL